MFRNHRLDFIEHDRVIFKIEKINLLHFRLVVKDITHIDGGGTETQLPDLVNIMFFHIFRIRKVVALQKQRIPLRIDIGFDNDHFGERPAPSCGFITHLYRSDLVQRKGVGGIRDGGTATICNDVLDKNGEISFIDEQEFGYHFSLFLHHSADIDQIPLPHQLTAAMILCFNHKRTDHQQKTTPNELTNLFHMRK